jgi:hypothetical protein
MAPLKTILNYNNPSENLYLKLFQIANQNLSLVQKEEKAYEYGKAPHSIEHSQEKK